jgi:hypothetical protein
VRHCLDVLDGYNSRFEQMKAAQMRHAAEHGTLKFRTDVPIWYEYNAEPPSPPRRVPSSELGEARRHLCDATYRWLIRCYQDGLIGETAVRQTCDSLNIGIEPSDLLQRT